MSAARMAIGASAVALFAWWATAGGGYAPGAWYPGALLVLAALVAAVRPSAWRSPPRPAQWALAALAAFTAWSFCSIAWADARGDAWDGANRTLLYLTVFALFALLRWTPREAAAWLGGLALATAGIGCLEVLRALAGAAPDAFADGRLAGPIGYENASAALFLAAFWAALLVAAQPGATAGRARAARAVLLAAAGLLAELTVLAQSRGSLIAGIATLVLAVAVVRERRSLLVALAAVAVVVGASLPALLGVYERASTGAEPDLWPAAIAMGASALLLLAAGWTLGPAERWAATHLRMPHPRALAGAAAVAAAVAAGLVLAGGPLTAAGGATDSRFTAGPGSGRYDFWRVAALEFVDHPLTGVGADNFAHDYVRDRRHGEEPLYPHSLAWRALAQTGLVGAALLALFVAAVAAAAWRAPDAARPVAAAALVAAAVWLVHGSIDWLWEIPAVAAPAMACLGLATALSSSPPSRGRARGRVAAVVVAALAGAAAASYALPALAAREIERAGREPDRVAAIRALERARDLNPLSDRADLVAGALALAAGDRDAARRSYLAALGRDDRNWHAQVQVALLDLQAGRREAALTRLEHARALNPGEELVAEALAVSRSGQPPPAPLLAALSEQALPGPIERRPVDCRPLLGVGTDCR
jgi:tetratricopeptide (TPR) repeat protein